MQSLSSRAVAIRTVLRGAISVLVVAVLSMLLVTSPAAAHAELRQSSPAAGQVVGGDIHAITLQFFDLDLNSPQVAQVFDAAGNELAGQLNREDQRIVIALVDPIDTPGEYLVSYAMFGIDGDFTEESFTFRWEEGAPEPEGITIELTEPVGFDRFNFALLLIGAAIAAFLAQRFLSALKEHRAAQRSSDAAP